MPSKLVCLSLNFVCFHSTTSTQIKSEKISGAVSVHLTTLLYPEQRPGRHSAPGPHSRRNHETFSMEADKKEKTRHNQFIKTAQPYKPKVSHIQEE